jgi:hypothetical protein
LGNFCLIGRVQDSLVVLESHAASAIGGAVPFDVIGGQPESNSFSVGRCD